MKKMRKIIPALAMLLVSAVMMSTASFAWFSMNTTVDATGMSVKATSSGGLAIAVKDAFMASAGDAPDASAYASTVAFSGAWTNGATSIAPVTHASALSWYSAVSDSTTDYQANSSGYTQVPNVTGTSTESATNFYKTQCVVKTLGETDGKLYLDQITITGLDTASDLDLSIRVAIEVNGTYKYFAPKRTADIATVGYKHWTGTALETYSVVWATTNTTSGTGASTKTVCEFVNTELGALDGVADGQTPTLVNIYVFFDGEDPACKSSNVQSLVNLSIDVKFASVAA